MYSTNFLLTVLILLQVLVCIGSGDNTLWTTITLEDPTSAADLSEKAVGISQERAGFFIVAVDRSSASSRSSTPVLYKATASGALVWTLESSVLKGTAFDVCVNLNEGVAYLLVSSPPGTHSSYANGHIIRFTEISQPATASNVRSVVSEDLFFSTLSARGNTKLFGCAIDQESGDLFLAGGTSDSLYTPSSGKSDVVVIRVSSSGQVLASTQFGTTEDEFGRAIDISADSSMVAVAVHRIFANGGVESVLYRLDAETLADSDGPRSLHNFGATPLFAPSDIAVSGPTEAEPNTMTSVISGSAFAVPDRKTDIFLHVFAKIGEEDSDVAIYIDGAENQKADDHGAAVKAGIDGNLYSIGYTNADVPSLPNALTLVVISPTGETIYKNGKPSTDNSSHREFPTAMYLVSDGRSGIHVAFVGYVQGELSKRPLLGFAIPPPGRITPFEGFGSVVLEAGTNVPNKTEESKDKGTQLSIVPIAAGAGGGIALILFLLVVLIAVKRRKNATRKHPADIFSPTHGNGKSRSTEEAPERAVFEQNGTLV